MYTGSFPQLTPPFSEIRTTLALPALAHPSPGPSTPAPATPYSFPVPYILRADHSSEGGGNVRHRIMGASVSTFGSEKVPDAFAPADVAPGWEGCVRCQEH